MRLIVTGANGALGSATTGFLAREAHSVAGIVRKNIAGSPNTVECEDLADFGAADRSIGRAADLLGGLDGIIHLAGAFEWKPVVQSDVELWRALYRANLETALCVVKAALPRLGPGGAIVTIGAFAAEPSGAGMGPYAASKSAVARLTESLAAEIGPGGVRINTLLPAIIDTPANRAAMPDADHSKWTDPEAIAEAAAFLVSPRARAINGALVPVTNSVGH